MKFEPETYIHLLSFTHVYISYVRIDIKVNALTSIPGFAIGIYYALVLYSNNLKFPEKVNEIRNTHLFSA